MKLKHIAALTVASVLVLLGFGMASHVFRDFKNNVIQQHGDKLQDVVSSVDLSAEGYFHLYRDSLEYITDRKGFLEAEQQWMKTGEAEPLLERMEDTPLFRDMHAQTILAVKDGKILFSADRKTGYILPENLSDIFLCRDPEGEVYLAVAYAHPQVCYVVLVSMEQLCDYLTAGSAVNHSGRMLLVDSGGQYFICHRDQKTDVLPVNETTLAKSPARQITLAASGTDQRQVSFCRVDEQTQPSTVGYALIGNAGSKNGFFTICVMDIYDPYLNDLEKDTVRFVGSCCVILLGIVTLLTYISFLGMQNRETAREVIRLQEKQAALEKINQQTQQLAHHQRLETIGTLTSSISHEFNNLLTPIMSYSLMTLEKLPPEEEELYDNVLEIYNASQKAKKIISRLSDLSRKNTPDTFRETSVDDLVKKALEIAMPAKPEGVEVKLNLNCWHLRIRANEIQLCQMLLNLILNAFQAMEQGGTLEIRSSFDDSSVQLYITDTGCGIPEENRKRIFDPFFTTKEPGKGTGLGLAIVAQVVEDHMGTISVSSVPGSTEFTIFLPRNTETE